MNIYQSSPQRACTFMHKHTHRTEEIEMQSMYSRGGGASYGHPYRSSLGSAKGREYSRSPSRGNETYSPVRHQHPTPSYEFRSSSAPKNYLRSTPSSNYQRSERTSVGKPMYSGRPSPQATSFTRLPPKSNGVFRTRERSPLFTNRDCYGQRSVVDAIPYSAARKNNSGTDRRYSSSCERTSEFTDSPRHHNSLSTSDYGRRCAISNVPSYIGDNKHDQRDDGNSYRIDRDAALGYTTVNAGQERERQEPSHDRNYRDDRSCRNDVSQFCVHRETDLSLNYSVSNLGRERADGRRELPNDTGRARDVHSSRGRGYSYSHQSDTSFERNDGSNITINVHTLPGQFNSLPSHLQAPEILQHAGISLAEM
uniref:Uncharacterized protein n=1 Tax=Chaetoceros debilis TaxID=122233 RepID=A0A7S3PXV3_9STRA|mmetsp:Transcript_20654/g.30470  ORF Transcript_20654/g.30470 Transcript_20654/m.30470 type:complete len:367 (+) Transcript_20654:47-1147(+)